MSLPFEDAGLPFEEALPFETGDALPPIISEAEAAKYAAARAVKGEEIKSTGIPEVDKHRRNLIGRTEAGASLVSGLAGLTAGLIGGPIKSAITGQPLEKSISDISEPLTYQPRTEAGQESLKPAGEFINRYMNPLLGHMNINMSGRPKKGKPTPVVRDMDAVIMEQKAATAPVKPIPTEAQMELPDAAMIRAPQYGVMEGMGRIDENGIPIKADVSMEARNLENPLQRNLWGDELPPKSPQEAPMGITAAMDTMQPGMRSGAIFREGLQEPLKAPESLTKAMDEATVPMRPKEGPFSLPDEPVNMGRGMGRSQSGAMNMAVLDPMFEKVKEISNNIKLIIKGREEGPLIRAIRGDRELARLELSPKQWADPTADSNLVATTVRSNAPGKNLAKEMYQFAAELKNDIEASPVRTEAGKHMWEKFNEQGLAKGDLIKGGPQPRDLARIATDLEGTYSQQHEQLINTNIAANLSGGMRGRQRGGFDYEILPKAFRDFVDNWKRAGGNLSYTGVSRMLDDHPVKLTHENRTLLASLYPETASKYQDKINHAIAESDLDKAKRWGQRYDDALIAEAVIKQHDAFNTGFTPDGPAYDAKTGRYAGKVAAQEQAHNAIQDAKINNGPGGRQRGALMVSGPKTPRKDTVANPISAENVKAKLELRQKAKALKLSAYDRVTTPEEALAGVSKETDISKAGNNSLRSGSEAVLRTNRNNTVVNFIRTKRQEAVNMFEEKSKQFVTGKDGVILSMKKTLKNQEEANAVAEALIKGDRAQIVFTEESLNKLGWSTAQKETYFKIREALDARYAFMAEQAGLQGYEPVKPRTGYVPSNFNGAYTKFVGHTNKSGNWVTKGIAQGNTTFELDAAIEKYKAMGPEYSEVIDGGFKGLKESKKNVKNYNGFAEILSRLAEFDPEFAKAKQIADQHMMDQARTLYNFDVHEIKKSGVKGSLGDRPWLDANKNTKDLFHSIVDYLETGFRYDAYQGFLMESEKLVNDPKVKAEMPNTTTWGQRYLDNIRGNNLNAVGAFVNSMVNTVAEAGSKVGVSTRFLPKTISAIQAGSTSMMMGFGNLGFAMMQMLQPLVGGIPEAMRIKAATGLGVGDVGPSFVMSPVYSGMMMMKQEAHVPSHIVEAWNWAKQHGLVDFSEAELAHNLESSVTSNMVNKSVNAPIIYPEKATRLPVFIAFTDMFHKAGFKGDEARLRAQAATDYAMGNYHPDERPQIYSQMGEAGKMLGALSTYKHNLIEQHVSSVINAKREKAAFATMAGVAFTMYGVSGLPGYTEMDKLVKGLTGKNIREVALPEPREKNLAMDGLISWYTDVDFQSRLSLSSVLPDPQKPLSVAPHINNFWGVTSAAIDYAMQQDQASLQQMISKGLPASFRHIYEVTKLSEQRVNPKTGENEYVVKNTKGQVNAENPRTEKEMAYRAALGLRPLRERINSETTWTDRQRELDRAKDMKEAKQQFEAAVRLSDMKGMARWGEKYTEAGGDIRQLYKQYGNTIVEGNKTPKQRAEGVPKNNINSIRRYENYNE